MSWQFACPFTLVSLIVRDRSDEWYTLFTVLSNNRTAPIEFQITRSRNSSSYLLFFACLSPERFTRIIPSRNDDRQTKSISFQRFHPSPVLANSTQTVCFFRRSNELESVPSIILSIFIETFYVRIYMSGLRYD